MMGMEVSQMMGSMGWEDLGAEDEGVREEEEQSIMAITKGASEDVWKQGNRKVT